MSFKSLSSLSSLKKPNFHDISSCSYLMKGFPPPQPTSDLGFLLLLFYTEVIQHHMQTDGTPDRIYHLRKEGRAKPPL